MENTNKTPMIFAKGIRFFKPRENAPKAIKGNIIIDLKEFKEFLNQQNITDLLRIDLRKSEEKGTYYFSLNTWKPTPKVEEIKKEDIPFD